MGDQAGHLLYDGEDSVAYPPGAHEKPGGSVSSTKIQRTEQYHVTVTRGEDDEWPDVGKDRITPLRPQAIEFVIERRKNGNLTTPRHIYAYDEARRADPVRLDLNDWTDDSWLARAVYQAMEEIA